MKYNLNRQDAVAKLGIENIPEEEQSQIIEKLEENIARRINIAIVERLNETDREVLASLSDEQNLEKFVRSKLEDLDTLMKTVAEQTIEEFLRIRDGGK
jgi:hypothetical protein